jgi:hypothetical protein
MNSLLMAGLTLFIPLAMGLAGLIVRPFEGAMVRGPEQPGILAYAPDDKAMGVQLTKKDGTPSQTDRSEAAFLQHKR